MPYRIGEVAERANVPEDFVRRLIDLGALPGEEAGLPSSDSDCQIGGPSSDHMVVDPCLPTEPPWILEQQGALTLDTAYRADLC